MRQAKRDNGGGGGGGCGSGGRADFFYLGGIFTYGKLRKKIAHFTKKKGLIFTSFLPKYERYI